MSPSASYIFFGSGEFAAGLLDVLVKGGLTPDLVISTPDKPRGRGLKLKPGPVPELCKQLGLPVLQPQKVNSPDFIAGLAGPDFILVSDFGHILKKPLLGLPKLAPLNLHPSLLPLWRGAAPLERSIMAGGPYGVTVFSMDEGMDTGPILLQREIDALSPYPTKGDLVARCLSMAPEMTGAAFEGLANGSLEPAPQEGEPTHAPKIEKSELRPDWARPAELVARHINALSPRPGARTEFRGKLLKLLRVFPTNDVQDQPGKTILSDERLMIACSEGAISVVELQPEAGKPMGAAEFIRGLRT